MQRRFPQRTGLMSRVKPITRRALLAMTSGLFACAQLQHAGAESGTDRDKRRPFAIAVSDLPDSSTSDGESWRDIRQTIISDLRASGRFVLIEPAMPIEEKVDAVPQFDKWRSIDAEVLVTGRVTTAPDQRSKAEFRLWDVVSGKMTIAQQYLLRPDDSQRVPHLMAEAIFERLTGRSGHFEAEQRK
jgi:TolB protein